MKNVGIYTTACIFFQLFPHSINFPHGHTIGRNHDVSGFAKSKQHAAFPKFISLI